ncbi:MAG: DNA internalization-related competence protein ComEC/Rec2 [Candidatus Cloacimonadales bacterium]|nr:DNA internalization-related competence protein ComEC/Rec2 [Candidatus Cloacimonadales bacterium]
MEKRELSSHSIEKRKLPSPLVLPAVFWAIGLIAGKSFHIPLLYLLASFILIFAFLFYRKFRIYGLLVSVVILGIMRIGSFQKLPENHLKTILQQHPQILQPIGGTIISEVSCQEGKYRFELNLAEIAGKPVRGKILFSTFQDSLQYGDQIVTVALLQKIRRSSNPAAFDYEEYLNAKNIFAQGYSKTPITVTGKQGNFFSKTVIGIRTFIRQRIEQRFGKQAGFVKAITIGDRRDIDETRQILNRAGLSHLLAVSGLHVGIISLVLFIFLCIIVPNRNAARIILIILLVIYGSVCNWSPSVFRAVLMISLFLISQILQRKVNTNNILFASFLIITALQPNQLFSAGFQMSFAAVFVLLNIMPEVRFLKLKKEEITALTVFKKIVNYLLILIVSSLVLNIFLAPITIYHFQQFGFNGLLGNLLGIPLIGLILPLALLIIFLPSITFLISIYQSAFQVLMLIFDSWTKLVSNLPAHFDFISLNLFQVFLIFLILGSIVVFFKQTGKRKIAISIGIVLIISLLISTFAANRFQLLKITFFDCGLGDLCLIESPSGEKIMIDTGPTEQTSGHFSRSALPYFQKQGCQVLDWLIITHAHNDHYGGMESVFANLEVKNLVVTDKFQEREIWPDFADMIAAENCRIITIIDTITLIQQPFKLKILHPDRNFEHTNINNLSIVARLNFADFCALFTGDLEHEGEKYLLEKYAEFLPADVLKVGHHGSRTASGTDFIKKVYPAHAFISTALQNRFDFPHPETLKTFEYLENQLFISGRDGALQITTDGKTARLFLFLSGQEYIDNDLK